MNIFSLIFLVVGLVGFFFFFKLKNINIYNINFVKDIVFNTFLSKLLVSYFYKLFFYIKSFFFLYYKNIKYYTVSLKFNRLPFID